MKQSLFFILTLLCIASAYSQFERVMMVHEKDYNAKTAEVMLRRLVEMGQTIGQTIETDSPLIETVFFVYDRVTKDASLLVVATHEESYLISSDKTYYVEDITELTHTYKFVYYLANNIDLDFGTLSLYSLETAFREYKNIL